MTTTRPLGVQDALWLEMDRPANLMVVDSLIWTAKPLDWERFAAVIRQRLWDRYPAFRSVAVRAGDGGWCWEERPDDDVAQHLTRVRLRKPGDAAALQRLIAAHRTAPLDRDKPLWQVLCVDGFQGGSAVVVRTHHAIADGIRMVQLAMTLFDATAHGGALVLPSARRHRAAGTPPGLTPSERVRAAVSSAVQNIAEVAATTRKLAETSLSNPVGAAHTAATLATSALGSTTAWLSSAMRPQLPGSGPLVDLFSAAPGDVDFVRKLLLGTRNDATCWTGTAGADKAVAWSTPLPLADVKAVARRHHVTVNDVLVTCVAGTLHDYLREHHAVCATANWMVPVNLKPFDAKLPEDLGNSFALVQLELPTDTADPLVVLDIVRRRMGRIKRGHEAALAFAVQRVISGLNKTVYQASVDLLANRAVGVLTNVPGPPMTVYLAGQKVEGMVGWAPLSGNQPMSFTIYSYDGKVFVGIACDAGLVPDHEQIVEGFAAAFRRLELATR